MSRITGYAKSFRDRLWIAVELLADGRQQETCRLREEGRRLKLPLVACGDVHMHRRSTPHSAGRRHRYTPRHHGGSAPALHLYPNGERHLRPREVLQRVYPQELLEETLHIAAAIDFSMDELRYEYPDELVPDGETPASISAS